MLAPTVFVLAAVALVSAVNIRVEQFANIVLCCRELARFDSNPGYFTRLCGIRVENTDMLMGVDCEPMSRDDW